MSIRRLAMHLRCHRKVSANRDHTSSNYEKVGISLKTWFFERFVKAADRQFADWREVVVRLLAFPPRDPQHLWHG
jgi:hypothetical protein